MLGVFEGIVNSGENTYSLFMCNEEETHHFLHKNLQNSIDPRQRKEGVDQNFLMYSRMYWLISSGFSWFRKCATPSMTITSSNRGTSFLNPPPCTYSLTPGMLYTRSKSPTINFVGTLTWAPAQGAVSSQFLQCRD